MYDVVTIGSATQDVFISADGFQVVADQHFQVGKALCMPFGSKLAVRKIVFASGGGGTNAAVTFSRQGFRTACLGVIGQDANGTAILDELRREGVDAKYFQLHSDDITAYSTVLVGSNGERTILSYKGEGIHWQAERIPWDRLASSWLYVNSLGGHEELLEAISTAARASGAHVATNPGSKELELGLDRLAKHWKHFDIVGMNQEEAAQLTGISYEREDEIFRTMDEAIGGIFIMTKGNDGVVVSDGHFVYTAGIPQQEVVERTGAGDAFHAGFTAEFMRTGSIEKAIQAATANASSVVMHYGAKAGILKKGQTSQWPLVLVQRRSL
jgi:ribokinase